MGVFFCLAVIIAAASATISPTGQTVVVNGISYYAAPESISVIAATDTMLSSVSSIGGLVPLTVIEDNSSIFTTTTFRSVVGNYISADDVFNSGFLQAIYLKHTGSAPANVKYPLGTALNRYGTKLFMPSQAYSSSVKIQGYKTSGWSTELPAGPYFMSTATGNVYKAYRLYTDIQGAFVEALKPNNDGTYSVLSAAVPGVQTLAVGVLSRLHYTKTAAKPLAGVRIGIKDLYDIAGVKTGCGSRAYYELYPAANATGPAVQSLIDAGAVIVGKMKTSQFANGEVATADWVDYHSPFNPRGDGYQDPSSSSSGPGAGIGAYSWLDIALGSDTGGSIRGPSEVNGCFGNRPSHGLVSLDGVMPLSPVLDTAGFLTRDPYLWHEAGKVLYGKNISSNFTSFPKKIMTSGFPVNVTTEASAILLGFLGKLTTYLNATVSVLDVDKIWTSTRPAVVANQSLAQVFGAVYPVLIAQQQYELLTIPFYADYAAKSMGKRPFVDPVPLVRWEYGQNNWTADATAQALQNKTIFMDWWSSKVMLPSAQSCSDGIMIYIGSSGTPTYRNVYRSPPTQPTGFSISRVSGMSEVPDVVFPIGQAAYNSTITLQTEYLPVTVDLVAAKGCDGMLFALAEELTTAGILKIPGVGSTMY